MTIPSITRTSIAGLRDSRVPNQVDMSFDNKAVGSDDQQASQESPTLVVAPRRCLPPLADLRETRPRQAEKSRPRRQVSAGGTSVTNAGALYGPMPGIVINRRAISLLCPRVLISASRLPIGLSRPDNTAISTSKTRRAACANPPRHIRGRRGAVTSSTRDHCPSYFLPALAFSQPYSCGFKAV